MKRRCSLRIDLLPKESSVTWQVFDRLTGVNDGITRTITAAKQPDPQKVIDSFNDTVTKAYNCSNYQFGLGLLQAWGSNTCKEVFPDEITRKLSSYDCGDILFMVPLGWADFPFELVYLQKRFLGQRFHIGTIISTGVPQGSEKQYNHGSDLMIIVDSSDRLPSACLEGECLKNNAISRRRQVRLLMNADREKLFAGLPGASIIHFAGHSGPDQEYDKAGWMLGNGKYFSTDDILKIGDSPVLPWLVFSNSCNAGKILVNSGLSGIAGAFLSAGIHQVVGPFCRLNDIQAKYCTSFFYKFLFKGQSASQALVSLRKKCSHETGLTPLFYRLFGDPLYRESTGKKLWRQFSFFLSIITVILFFLTAGINHLHKKSSSVKNTEANEKINNSDEKPGGIIFDLKVGDGLIHFSVNLYAPAFIYKAPESNPSSELHQQSDSMVFIDDTAVSNP